MTTLLASATATAPVITRHLSDEDLLLRIQADDQEAYQILVERHVDRAFGIALRILRNAADAEDVAQEALVRTWTNRHSWQPGRAKFTTWLYRVVVNRCIDLSRSPSGEQLDDVPEPVDESDDSVVQIHRQEVHAALETAMARLPKQQRAALILSYYEECSNAQVAEIMGTSIDAVESLLKRGRQRLRDLLKGSAREFGRISYA